ncbi:MAG: ABC transporter permease subunit [Pseudonocardia sp.]|nr:ABC transporter permease subunit [Pseudonocardia sp.]
MATLAQPRARQWRISTSRGVVGVLLAWVVLWIPLHGINTLALASSELTPLHTWLNGLNEAVNANRSTSPFFLYVIDPIRLAIDALVRVIQGLISQPALGRPAPVLGWLGVVAVAGFLSWAFGNVKVGLLTVFGLLFIGLQGLWQEAMDTLALTLAAVLVSLLIGIPLGVWAGLSRRVERAITPGLDFMQTMPTFVYLAPLTLFFLIGPASATIATLIYAVPPVVRITAYGIRSVPATTIEATESLGSTRAQTLTKVLLPMSRRTIVLGINQTIMAALSMVTIAALIDAPGLGKTVIKALQTLDVGTAFNAGLAIVVLAIILDRVTTAAAARADVTRAPSPREHRRRQVLLAVGGVLTVVCMYLSYTYVWASTFPSTEIGIGSAITRFADTVTDWAQTNLSLITAGFKDGITRVVLDSVEALLVQSPWWLTTAAVLALAALLGGLRAVISGAICLALLIATGLWSDAMATLAATIVATAIVMVFGIVVGVWMGRSARADRVTRPVLDAAQVMPAFVYLVPFLALFAASRFTAIVAAIVFAAPVAIKIVADGIRTVPAVTVEAATSAGSSTWQLMTKVQLPMARSALTLATNQGLIYVLSMVVVGGLVGAGALGFDVVAGFSQGTLFGKGLAAGLAIVLLGIMLDRISQAAARRARDAR